MPAKWTSKDERQYQHIRDTAKERGKPEGRAKEIAARTVNKQRFAEGRTATKKSRATGNPQKPLQDRTRTELYNMAAKMHIPGRSSMKKDELAVAIRRQR